MWEHIKDYWELVFASIGTLIAGVSGFEHLRSRVGNLEKVSDSKAVFCSKVMTKENCDERQDDCKKLQSVNHQHISEVLTDIKAQNQMILDHLLGKIK